MQTKGRNAVNICCMVVLNLSWYYFQFTLRGLFIHGFVQLKYALRVYSLNHGFMESNRA